MAAADRASAFGGLAGRDADRAGFGGQSSTRPSRGSRQVAAAIGQSSRQDFDWGAPPLPEEPAIVCARRGFVHQMEHDLAEAGIGSWLVSVSLEDRAASDAATRYGLSTTHFSAGSAARLSAEALDSAASARTEDRGDLIGRAKRSLMVHPVT